LIPFSFAIRFISSGVKLLLSNKAISSGFEILPPFFCFAFSISLRSSLFVRFFLGDEAFSFSF